MNGLSSISEKLLQLFKVVIHELSKVSWVGALAIAAIGGLLYMFGNEFGAKKLCKDALVGYIIIQIVSMLAG